MYAERWNELSVSRFPWTEVVKRNGDIRTLRGMYEEERRRTMRYKIRSDQNIIPAVTKDKLDLSGRKVGKVQARELENGIKGACGRIVVSLNLGKGKAGKSRWNRITDCKNVDELCIELGTMRAWKVMIRQDTARENRIPGNGYCGYIAINQLMRGKESHVNVNERAGRLEICENTRSLINSGPWEIRDGWREMGSRERNGKERALGAIAELEGNGANWLSQTTLAEEFWLHSSLLTGKMAAHKVSR